MENKITPLFSMNCGITRQSNKFTCYTLIELILIAKIRKIKYSNLSKHDLWNSLKQVLADIPEEKWLNSKYAFKPKSLYKGRWKWLSNFDIEKVLDQYSANNKNFEFQGVFSSDYFQLFPEKKKMLQPNAKTKGMVFNLDTHDMPGSHWVSLISTIYTIEYFDSNGDTLPKNLLKVVKEKLGTRKLKINKNQHQIKDGVCGLYSINFLIARMLGVSFEEFSLKKFDDRVVDDMRNVYFRF